jgi:nitrate/nitrite transporter NarK
MGEAGAYPNMAGVVARWFPAKERAAAQGYIWGASRAGGALAPLLVVPIQQALGWRASFWIFGACGVLWCAAWWWSYKDDPAQSRRISRAELEELRRLQRPAGHTLEWSLLWRSRQLWTIVLMYGTYAWGGWFYFSWLHTYLIKARGFTESEMAVAAALPFVCGSLANIAGGHLSDYAVRKLGLQRGRTWVGASCLAAAACLVVATAVIPGKTAAMALLALGFGVMDLMLPSAWAICLDIGGEHAGAVTGAMNTAGQLGGFVCTVVFGYLVTYFQSYNAPLFLIAGMLFVSAALFARIDAARPLFPSVQIAEKAS